MEQSLEKAKSAREDLRKFYDANGWTTWPVNPESKTPYQIGINLNNTSERKDFESQISYIQDVATIAAKQRGLGLEVYLEGPVPSHGGASMYVGLSYINPQLQKRFEDYKILKNAIKETKNGYNLDYKLEDSLKFRHGDFHYDELDNHLALMNGGYLWNILDAGKEELAKKMCYTYMFNYLRENSIVKEGKLCFNAPKYEPEKGYEPGGEHSRFTRFKDYSDEELDKLNLRRGKRGLEPVGRLKPNTIGGKSITKALEHGCELLEIKEGVYQIVDNNKKTEEMSLKEKIEHLLTMKIF